MEEVTDTNLATHSMKNNQDRIYDCLARAIEERAKDGNISTSTASDMDNLLKDLLAMKQYYATSNS